METDREDQDGMEITEMDSKVEKLNKPNIRQLNCCCLTLWWRRGLACTCVCLVFISLIIAGAIFFSYTYFNQDTFTMWSPPDGRTRQRFIETDGLSEEEFKRTSILMDELTRLLGFSEELDLTDKNTTKDLLYSADQARQLIDYFKNQSGSRKKRKAPIGTRLWQLNDTQKIHYSFDGSHSRRQMADIRRSIKEIEEQTVLKFQEYDSKSRDKHSYYLLFMGKTQGCYTYLGQVLSIQIISLTDVCFFNRGVIHHEILHSMGLPHEQQRSDRDKYIKIHLENMGYYSSQFRALNTNNLARYDYHSVMHYSSKVGSNNHFNTMTPTNKFHLKSPGQRFAMTFYDAKAINIMYRQDLCQGVKLNCRSNGYVDKKNCKQCICHEGLTGRLCDQIAPSYPATCGGDINLLSDFKSSEMIKTPGYGLKGYSYQNQCTWKVKVAPGRRIKLEFIGVFSIFETIMFSDQVCAHYVDLYLDSNFKYPDAKLCGYQRPSSLFYSNDNQVLIHFSSKMKNINYPNTIRGFSMNISLVDASYIPSTTTPTTTTTTTPEPTTVQKAKPGDYAWKCTFEDPRGGDQGSFCDLDSESGSRDRHRKQWTLRSGPTPSRPTGPDAGVGGKGYYIYLEASMRERGDYAQSQIKRGLVPAGQYCLDLHYHMFGHHIGKLMIFTLRRGRTVFQKVGTPRFGLQNNWHHARADVTLEQNDSIIFKAIRARAYSGDIALDEIFLFKNYC